MDDLTKVSFNAHPRAVTAINMAADHAQLPCTDILNRAVQVYAGIIELSWWAALRVLFAERVAVRRIAAKVREEA